MVGDRLTQRTVTAVMAVIAGLAFVFSFGNVWALALRLGVPRPIAPLIAPMVDLSVLGLLVGLRHLSLRGVPARELRSAVRLMHLSGLLTLGLNIAEPLLAGHYGRAALDAVAPVLLLGWGAVGPGLLRHLHTPAPPTAEPTPAPVPATAPVPAPEPSAPEHSAPASPPEPLLAAARRIATAHQSEHGEPITPERLTARLDVAPALAETLHARLTA
ncbi:DUF2637 domain-containing protein [Streptomyces sp. 7-21]|uniref:DUF2637 domain-containing protein n=1 Tax=Streptomyces sp. 7-21 TaxID=2802283 RepID=UPI00191D2DF4|nr:DUF2637 domain-containing protein [Streptomyces sp. 7-21]MBL1067943.1 DUF2637 domain-containing protein [Streptomyces sp. 7-21]